MYFDLYQIIIAIEQTRSFSKAARLLHMSQPAISNKVQIMESYYGAKLFHRTSNGVTLTDAGKMIYSYAKEFEKLHNSMKNDINTIMNPIEQNMIIGTSCIMGKTLPYIINAYKKVYPNTNYKINISDPLTQLKELEKQAFDFIIISEIFDELNNNQFVSHVIGFHDFVLIAPNSGGWKNTDSISINDLGKYPLIVRESGATARIILEKTLLAHGCTLDNLNIASEMNSIYAIRSAVASGWGLALVPEILVEEDINTNKLKTIDINELKNEPLKVAFCIIYLKNNEMKPPAKHFIDFLIHNKHRYSEKSGIFI